MPSIVYDPQREYPSRKGARYIQRQLLEPGKSIKVSDAFVELPEVKELIKSTAIVVLTEEFITEPKVTVVEEPKKTRSKKRSDIDELPEIGKDKAEMIGEIV